MAGLSAVAAFFTPLINWIFALYQKFSLDLFVPPEKRLRNARSPISGPSAHTGNDYLNRYIFQNLHATEATTECRICLDDHPHSESVFVGGCHHGFCRDGLKQHVISKLRDGAFPVLCPVCAMENGNMNPGIVNYALLEYLGLSDDEFVLWTNLELAPLVVTIQCPRCRETFRVDQTDYQCVDTIHCPLGTCNTSWCKNCFKIVKLDAPHTCMDPNKPRRPLGPLRWSSFTKIFKKKEKKPDDGSKQFEKLLKKKGWKKCPDISAIAAMD